MLIQPANLRRVLLAAATIAAGAWQTAGAVGTAANTSIANQATVSYSVGGNAQTPIPSSPTGNSTPGGGAPKAPVGMRLATNNRCGSLRWLRTRFIL